MVVMICMRAAWSITSGCVAWGAGDVGLGADMLVAVKELNYLINFRRVLSDSFSDCKDAFVFCFNGFPLNVNNSINSLLLTCNDILFKGSISSAGWLWMNRLVHAQRGR